MNAVIQKQAVLPGTNSIAFPGAKTGTPQSIIIPRGSEGIQVASALTPNYITVNQLATSQPSAVLTSGGQVIQGSPFAFSQIQDFSQAGKKIHFLRMCVLLLLVFGKIIIAIQLYRMSVLVFLNKLFVIIPLHVFTRSIIFCLLLCLELLLCGLPYVCLLYGFPCNLATRFIHSGFGSVCCYPVLYILKVVYAKNMYTIVYTNNKQRTPTCLKKLCLANECSLC